MIHFKLRMEYENEKKKFYSLHRIGIRDEEVRAAVYKKILVVFMVSPIYAIFLACTLLQVAAYKWGYGVSGALLTVAIAVVLMMVHSLVYKNYARIYCTDITSEIYQ